MKTERRLAKREAVDAIVEMRAKGMTFAEIGSAFGVSRQRVHQIAALFSVPPPPPKPKPVKRNHRVMRESFYGCSSEEIHNIREEARKDGLKDPLRPYVDQKRNAARRGVEFLFSLKEWWEAWKPYYAERGLRNGGYVMCRQGDTGPYAAGNVYFATQSANMLDHHKITRSCQAKAVDHHI